MITSGKRLARAILDARAFVGKPASRARGVRVDRPFLPSLSSTLLSHQHFVAPASTLRAFASVQALRELCVLQCVFVEDIACFLLTISVLFWGRTLLGMCQLRRQSNSQ